MVKFSACKNQFSTHLFFSLAARNLAEPKQQRPSVDSFEMATTPTSPHEKDLAMLFGIGEVVSRANNVPMQPANPNDPEAVLIDLSMSLHKNFVQKLNLKSFFEPKNKYKTIF